PWDSRGTCSCIARTRRVGGLWLRLPRECRDPQFVSAALGLNRYVKATQLLHTANLDLRGGVKGSQPIFGRYTPLTFVNWAAKFFADALMLEEHVAGARTTEVAS